MYKLNFTQFIKTSKINNIVKYFSELKSTKRIFTKKEINKEPKHRQLVNIDKSLNEMVY